MLQVKSLATGVWLAGNSYLVKKVNYSLLPGSIDLRKVPQRLVCVVNVPGQADLSLLPG